MRGRELEIGIKDHAVPRFYVPVVLKFLGGNREKRLKKAQLRDQ